MKNKKLFAGMLASALVFGLVFTGCPNPGGGGGTTDAATPTITIDLTPASNHIYKNGATANALTIAAATSDSGTLSYQWKVNSTDSNSGGSNASGSGATTNSFTPLTTTNGTSYYFCVVTNTNNSVNGNKTATATSKTAKIKVQDGEPTSAATPTIDKDLSTNEVTYYQGDTASDLSVSASASDGGTLSYQWYKSTDGTTATASKVGTNSSTYTPVITDVGTLYYAVLVTNTKSDKDNPTAQKMSSMAKITVHTLTTIANGAAISGGSGTYSGGPKGKNDISAGGDSVHTFSIDSSNKVTIKLTDPTSLDTAGNLTVLSYYTTGDLSSTTNGAKFDVFTGVTLTSPTGYAITQAIMPSGLGSFTMAIYVYSDTANANLTGKSKTLTVSGLPLTIGAFNNLTLAKGWNKLLISGNATMSGGTASVSVGTIDPSATWGWD
ncbi:MAG: hypothetical protein LBM77_02410 [Spirochaetaceae bacterium]|jgi:hypothetical protein|nr:hypothetical protein [Spirochaetaceae bacterium]